MPAAGRWQAALFWAGAAAFAAMANATFALLLPAPAPSEDSYGYLAWSLIRTVGYPALLWAYDAAFPTWTALPLVQLNLLLAGLLALCHAVVRVTGSRLAGWLVLALVAAAAQMLLSAHAIMTEAPFAAALMLHVAGVFLLLAGAGRGAAALAGLGLAAAILVKSVATVLLGPMLLVAAFGPRARRRLLFLSALPAIVAWAVPSAINLARHGVLESSVAGGYALAGHVGWAIRPQPGSAHAPIAARIEARLRPVLAERPGWNASRAAYTEYTTREYNTLLWKHIVPEVSRHLGREHCPRDHFFTCRWSGCPARCLVLGDRILMALSREAIADQPRAYAYHVFAHTDGLWARVFARPVDFTAGTEALAAGLPHFYRDDVTSSRPLLEPVPEFPSPDARAAMLARIQGSPAKRLVDLVTLRDLADPVVRALERHAWPLPLCGLVALGLLTLLGRLPPAAAAFCYAGLALDAYFLGTALAQPALARYAWPAQGVAAAMLATGAWAAAGAIASQARLRAHRGPVESSP